MPASEVLAKITVQGRKALLRPVVAFVREAALTEGFTEAEARRLELVAEESCLNVIQHALEGDEKSTYDVVLERRPAQFVLAVEDRGLPFDWRKCEKGDSEGLGLRLMRAFTDEIRFVNLGRGGKRLEFIKHFAPRTPADPNAESPEAPAAEAAQGSARPAVAPIPADVPIRIRFMTPEDGVALARCMYRCYGYTYWESVYIPEKMRELLASGLRASVVADTPDGEIVGHLALMKEQADSRVAEIGQAVVDPRCRGRKLFEQMKTQFIDYSQNAGLYGLYSEAVALHPYSQKGNHALGSTETGILLAHAPQTLSYRQIQEQQTQRITTVLFYLRTNDEPERTVYPPFHHKSMVARIFEYGHFRRKIERPSAREALNIGESAQIDVNVNVDFGIGVLRVARWGADIQDLIRVRLRELCLSRLDVIFVDLPLSDPATSAFCAPIEALGFFFAGVVPELAGGDVLRLQYLNNVSVDPSKVVVVSDFAKELFKYVLDACGQRGN